MALDNAGSTDELKIVALRSGSPIWSATSRIELKAGQAAGFLRDISEARSFIMFNSLLTVLFAHHSDLRFVHVHVQADLLSNHVQSGTEELVREHTYQACPVWLEDCVVVFWLD